MFLSCDNNYYFSCDKSLQSFIIIRYSSMFRLLSNSIANKFTTSVFPKFVTEDIKSGRILKVIHTSEAEQFVPENERKQFKEKNRITFQDQGIKNTVISEKGTNGVKLTKNTAIEFSQNIQKQSDFKGIASSILSSGFKFNRKEKVPDGITVSYKNFADKDYIMELVESRIKSKQWANTRGNEANPQFFEDYCRKIAKQLPIKITVIKGDQLLKEGFRLMHAVGRASRNEPTFINLSYEGNPQSKQWVSFVGKGVCFDAGGLNLKPSSGIKDMHMDKHGSTSVLSAFESAVRLKLKVNLTASLGYVQNFINQNAFRPNDIIKSRKGLTVEIGNTDAQGRLVLADCMHWTQQNYKLKTMIELSTLTGAIVIALGKHHAGLFSNCDQLSKKFIQAGKQVKQYAWRMPVQEYHHEIIKAKHADISNAPGKSEASSSQAAAFLQRFVNEGVSWIHLDIAGTAHIDGESTGYGSRVLLNYLKNQI